MTRPRRGQLRIIGGDWRSRRIGFADAGVRPTPDRVRQTLFDWLAPVIAGSRCLDLFAGSGLLGIEALSRGAAWVDFVDTGAAQVTAINAALATLGADSRATAVRADAMNFLAAANADRRWDIVFLDPPYDSDLLAPSLAQLPPRLAPGARVYLEWQGRSPPPLPTGLAWLREKRAGRVSFGLAVFGGTAT